MENNGQPKVLSSNTLLNNPVVNNQSEELGKIEEFMIDLNNGRIAYVVLSFGGVLGLGDKFFAIPWEALKLDTEKHQFILNLDKDKIDSAEGFDKDDWPDMTSTEWGEKIFDFYGYEPYWR